jgi:DNA-binding response OmpR family regulator
MSAVSVLAVCPAEDDRVLLEHIFSHSNWKLDCVHTCAEAGKYLGGNVVSVVLCAHELPDGNWKVLLENVARQTVPPRLLVYSRSADDGLWAEVLDLGGYDVLRAPFDHAEVIRVVSLAWRQWKHEFERLTSGRPPATVGNESAG